MKKTFVMLAFLLVCCAVFAFSFEFGPEQSFFNQFKSDQFVPKTRLGAIVLTQSSPQGNLIRFDKKDGVPGQYYGEFKQFNSEKDNYFLQLQAGGGVSAFRFSWNNFEVGGRIEAYLRGVFFLLNGNDVLGFDGSYFMGFEAKILSSIVLKAGFRHFSGHVGDEVLHSLFQEDSSFVNASLSEYVRDDFELAIGFSSVSFPYITGGISFEIPRKSTYMLPFVHRPDYILSGGKTNQERDPDSYAIRGDYGASYLAMVINGELTASYPFRSCTPYLSLQCRFHQDGTTNHTLVRDDDTGRWETEFDIALGLSRNVNGRILAIEAIWHNGRFPLLNYDWKRDSSISIVFSIS